MKKTYKEFTKKTADVVFSWPVYASNYAASIICIIISIYNVSSA